VTYPVEGSPEPGIDLAAIVERLASLAELDEPPPEIPATDGSAFQAAAEASCSRDVGRIRAIGARLVADLDAANVDLLDVDLFKLPTAKQPTAEQAAAAVRHAVAYVACVTSEGPEAEARSRAYADAVTKAWTAKETTEAAAYDAWAEGVIQAFARAEERLEQLTQARRALEEEQHAGPGERRAEEIRYSLLRIETEELSSKLTLAASGKVTAGREFMHGLRAVNTLFAETSNLLWQHSAVRLGDIRTRRQRRDAWLARVHAGLWFGYTLLVVALGVILDAALDRWMISPRLERRKRRKDRDVLKDEVETCVETLSSLRELQIGIDIIAASAGIPQAQVLGPEVLSQGSEVWLQLGAARAG
jgi:hypothetical protein